MRCYLISGGFCGTPVKGYEQCERSEETTRDRPRFQENVPDVIGEGVEGFLSQKFTAKFAFTVGVKESVQNRKE